MAADAAADTAVDGGGHFENTSFSAHVSPSQANGMMGASAPPPMQLPTRSGPSPCSEDTTEIVTGLDDLFGLAVNTRDVYVGTTDGVVRTGHDGSDMQQVV